MASDVCVVFSSGDSGYSGGLFQTALGILWSRFVSREGEAIIFASAQGRSLSPQDGWDLVVVWDYGAQKQLAWIVSRLQERMQEVVQQGGFIHLIQHGGSGNNFPQQAAFAMGANLVTVDYTRQRHNPVYKAVADVLQTTDASAYQAALQNLLVLVSPLYDLVIDILRAFLPADLAWQVGTPEAADEAARLLPNKGDILSTYVRVKRLAQQVAPAAMLDAGGQACREMFSASLPKNPHQFHETYVRLRDDLFKIVEAVEHRSLDGPQCS